MRNSTTVCFFGLFLLCFIKTTCLEILMTYIDISRMQNDITTVYNHIVTTYNKDDKIIFNWSTWIHAGAILIVATESPDASLPQKLGDMRLV